MGGIVFIRAPWPHHTPATARELASDDPSRNGLPMDDGIAATGYEDLVPLKDLVASGKFKPVMDRCYPPPPMVETRRYVETGHKKRNVVIPVDGYFMMGDNRDNSDDSRYFGFVERNRIVGRATSIVISLDIKKNHQPRWKRFFTDLP